ncbi:MAG TPA: GNAT family N-acetyltransferase, partial [Spirochaetes bacterium]|nr:GNAT family N-acetyltransferase [Spirochaetota bacterium]
FPYPIEDLPETVRVNLLGCAGADTGDRGGRVNCIPLSPREIPSLILSGAIPVDVAMVHTSRPDPGGKLSLGVWVHALHAATGRASIVMAQVNSFMPRVHGNGFITMDRVDFIFPADGPLPSPVPPEDDDDIAGQIGARLAGLVSDGDTLQVGPGSLPDQALRFLDGRKHLGVHTEVLTEGIVGLMKEGAVDNSMKTLNRGKTVCSCCEVSEESRRYIDDNPFIETRPVDYTNDQAVIGAQRGLVAVNTVREIDLTGQADGDDDNDGALSTPCSTDFTRGAALSPDGKSVIVISSTRNGGALSRIVPFLPEGAGVTVNRGDAQFVITEYGMACLKGKNIRERAMELIGIAHPAFRPWLIDEAKKAGLIYKDQRYISSALYPDYLEKARTTPKGVSLLLRPVKISDEALLKEFFYSLSDRSVYRRFMTNIDAFHHEVLQQFSTIDYSREMMILALDVRTRPFREKVLGTGQYIAQKNGAYAEAAFAVRDDCHNAGIGHALAAHLAFCARRAGIRGFRASVFAENKSMLRVFEKLGFDARVEYVHGVIEITMDFDVKTP